MIQSLREKLHSSPISDIKEIKFMLENELGKFIEWLKEEKISYFPSTPIPPTDFKGLKLPINIQSALDTKQLFLIKLNTPIIKPENLTFLHCAVILEKPCFVDELLKYGVDISIKNMNGYDAGDFANLLEDKAIFNKITAKRRLEKNELKKISEYQLNQAHEKTRHLNSLHGIKNTSRNIIADRLLVEIWSLMTDRKLCNKYLQQLNTDVSAKIRGLTLPRFDNKRYKDFCGLQFLLPTQEFKNPDIWMKALEEALLSQEQKHGVNIGLRSENVPELVGIVSYEKADKIILSNQLFNDCVIPFLSFTHGKYAHRIQYYIITKAIEDSEFDISFLPKKIGILKYLTYSETNYYFSSVVDTTLHRQSYWQMTLDNSPESQSLNFRYTIGYETKIKGQEILCNRWHLAGATETFTYTTSENAFLEWPFLATSVYASVCEAYKFLISSLSSCRIYIPSHPCNPDTPIIEYILQHIEYKNLSKESFEVMAICAGITTEKYIAQYNELGQFEQDDDGTDERGRIYGIIRRK
jgi:hypothetical protein